MIDRKILIARLQQASEMRILVPQRIGDTAFELTSVLYEAIEALAVIEALRQDIATLRHAISADHGNTG